MEARNLFSLILLATLVQAACCHSIASQQPQDASQTKNNLGDQLRSATSRFGTILKNGFRPAVDTILLMRRYHNWMVEYRKFRSDTSKEVDLKDAATVLKEEYTRADEDLESSREAAGDSNVNEILQLAIERLESRLAKLRAAHAAGKLTQLVAIVDQKGIDETRIRASLSRAKSSVMNSGGKLVMSEMSALAQCGLYNSLAAYFEQKPDVGDPLDQLRPIVMLMGSASTPLIISYLISVESRLFMGMFEDPAKQLLDKLRNQIPKLNVDSMRLSLGFN